MKSFDVDLVDEDGNSVPLYETYFHHWFAIKYFENMSMSLNSDQYHDPNRGKIYQRNEGACQSYFLPHYWGLGAESRGTPSNLPNCGVPNLITDFPTNILILNKIRGNFCIFLVVNQEKKSSQWSPEWPAHNSTLIHFSLGITVPNLSL